MAGETPPERSSVGRVRSIELRENPPEIKSEDLETSPEMTSGAQDAPKRSSMAREIPPES